LVWEPLPLCFTETEQVKNNLGTEMLFRCDRIGNEMVHRQ
jgi:hypothetical protein